MSHPTSSSTHFLSEKLLTTTDDHHGQQGGTPVAPLSNPTYLAPTSTNSWVAENPSSLDEITAALMQHGGGGEAAMPSAPPHQHHNLAGGDATGLGLPHGGEGETSLPAPAPMFRDVWAAMLFAIQLVVMIYLALRYGVAALRSSYGNKDSNNNNNNGSTSSGSVQSVLVLCLLTIPVAWFLSGAALWSLTHYAHQWVQMSLFLAVAANLVVAAISLGQHWWIAAALALMVAAWSALYAAAVWRRIPFTAANLQTAVAAVSANRGLLWLAYVLSLLMILVNLLWLLAWYGVYQRRASQTENQDHDKIHPMHIGVVCFFLLTYLWTMSVIKNVLHVTVAGVVGTFWFAPQEAQRTFSPALHDSFVRASTYSLGSICLGSLLTSIIQTLYHLARAARRQVAMQQDQGRGEFLICMVECFLSCLERIVSYFHQYAYVYIGLYGYDYLTAGQKVWDLFTQRGWTTLIHDHLVSRVLLLLSVVLATLTGLMGAWLAQLIPWIHGNSSTAVAWGVPWMMGWGTALIAMSVIGSAVDTVLVAFAEAPLELERHHPGLHRAMVTAWRQVYPDEYQL